MGKIIDFKTYQKLLALLTALVLPFTSLSALAEKDAPETTNEVRQEEMIKNDVDIQETQEVKQMTYDEFIEKTTKDYNTYSFYYMDHPITLEDFQLGFFMLNIEHCKNIAKDLFEDDIIFYDDYEFFRANLEVGWNISNILSAPRFPGWHENFDFLHYEEKDIEAYRELNELSAKIIYNAFEKKKIRY